MSVESEKCKAMVEAIPDEIEVKRRLADNLREASVLRALLRAAKLKSSLLRKGVNDNA